MGCKYLFMQIELKFTLCQGFKRLGEFKISTNIAIQAYDYFCEIVKVSNADTCIVCGPKAGNMVFLDVCGKCNFNYMIEIILHAHKHTYSENRLLYKRS